MRQLHPVSFRERFVASGTYTFFQDAVPTGDVEHWTLHEPGQGAWTVRADHDGRAGSGTSWLFEGLYDGERRRFERFDLSLYGAQHTDAKFIFEPGEVQISLRVDGVARDQFVIPVPTDAAPQPPALVGAYLFIPGVVDSLQVFMPELDFAAGLVRGGTVETLSVEYRDTEPLVISVYGERALFADISLDQHDILLHWETPTGLAAHLSQYVHRPETTP